MGSRKVIIVDPMASDDPVARDADELLTRLANLPLQAELGESRRLMLQSFRDNFTSSATADGQNWPERKNPGDGHPLLMDTGALLQAAVGGGVGHESLLSDRELSLGIDSDVRQGGIPAAVALDQGNERMPARRFYDVKLEHIEQIDRVLIDGIYERL